MSDVNEDAKQTSYIHTCKDALDRGNTLFQTCTFDLKCENEGDDDTTRAIC